ncbi:MAG: ATP-binding protein [Betaproteobacteria bacterium]|nr:ATP-binding protein [Betaproteobacteria bacterium]MBI2958783.1 ATP-binding protein [Betaproteobacteria bacterium]
MIRRTAEAALRELSARYPVVTVTGPRQSGKTTLARACFAGLGYANLEQPDVRRFAVEDPRGFLRQHARGAVLDEFQRAPEIVSYLQAEVDADAAPGRFILTGSEQLEVLNRVSQSLAGRTGLLKLLPFSIEEMSGKYPVRPLERLIYSGFYPRIHDQGLEPAQALADYFATAVQRDLRSLMNVGDLIAFERFVRLCAGRCAQLLSLSALGADAGVSHTTATKWLSLLEASYIVFRLPPYFWNTNKRLVKSPKLFFFDVGLAAHLLGIQSAAHVLAHPLRGALFENLVVVETLKYFWHRARRAALHFYRDSGGNEIDLLIELGHGVFPLEIKAGETVNPDYFHGLRAFARLYDQPPKGGALVYAGSEVQERSGTWVLPPERLPELLAPLAGV